jgi:signal transduction histidine kinase
MHLDTQTTIFMICFVYVMLHGAIWLALQEHRSYQVKLWCASGMISGLAVVLLAMRGTVSEFVFMVVAQLLMLVGNWGRMVALRIYLLPAPQHRAHAVYTLVNIAYFLLFVYLIYFQQAEWEALMVFNAFYAVLCFDYFRIGRQVNKRQISLGANLLMWAGSTLTVTLGIRTVGVFLSGTIDDIYQPSWHQAVMVIGQFTAITLSNIAFLRIFLEIAERKKMTLAQDLAVSTERASAMHNQSEQLKQVLREREEIIRQLALFNKTAGMGALVASLAHELNQPLTAIQLNAELIESAFTNNATEALDDATLKEAMGDLMKDNQRAASIIRTLRNMFGSGNKTLSTFDVNELMNDVVLICRARLHRNVIDLVIELSPQPLYFTGDKSQLRQVFLNLITNANDAFLPNQVHAKRIEVRTLLKNDKLVVSVTDNGTGIAPDIAASMFELLRTNKDDGMGVGLWLSRTIVESHHGSIDFVTSPGGGTTFTVTLPVTAEQMVF